MDYTYFYITNSYLGKHKLKLALVLNHEKTRFEIWLLGQTKDVQEKYWNLLKLSKWIMHDEIPQYSIFEVTLIDKPDFNDLDVLTAHIKEALSRRSNEIIATLKTLQ